MIGKTGTESIMNPEVGLPDFSDRGDAILAVEGAAAEP